MKFKYAISIFIFIIIILLSYILIIPNREYWARNEAIYRYQLRWKSTLNILNNINVNSSVITIEIEEILKRGNSNNNIKDINMFLSNNDDPNRRAIAVFILYKIGDIDAKADINDLIASLNINVDNYNGILLIVGILLGPSDSEFLPTIQQLLNSDDSNARYVAELAISHINDPSYSFTN